jgi:hypothetical protein
MRDPKRIWKLCRKLATAWELLPDWRFGQLLSNVFDHMKADGKDPFYLEDDSMIEYIEQYIEKYTGIALHE